MIRITGSADQPLSDSLSRGLIVAALQGLLAFLVVRVDWLTTEDIVYLAPALTLVSYLLWGAFDRWGRPHLPSA